MDSALSALGDGAEGKKRNKPRMWGLGTQWGRLGRGK